MTQIQALQPFYYFSGQACHFVYSRRCSYRKFDCGLNLHLKADNGFFDPVPTYERLIKVTKHLCRLRAISAIKRCWMFSLGRLRSGSYKHPSITSLYKDVLDEEMHAMVHLPHQFGMEFCFQTKVTILKCIAINGTLISKPKKL